MEILFLASVRNGRITVLILTRWQIHRLNLSWSDSIQDLEKREVAN